MMGKQVNVTLSDQIIEELELETWKTGASNIQEVIRKIIGDYFK